MDFYDLPTQDAPFKFYEIDLNDARYALEEIESLEWGDLNINVAIPECNFKFLPPYKCDEKQTLECIKVFDGLHDQNNNFSKKSLIGICYIMQDIIVALQNSYPSMNHIDITLRIDNKLEVPLTKQLLQMIKLIQQDDYDERYLVMYPVVAGIVSDYCSINDIVCDHSYSKTFLSDDSLNSDECSTFKYILNSFNFKITVDKVNYDELHNEYKNIPEDNLEVIKNVFFQVVTRKTDNYPYPNFEEVALDGWHVDGSTVTELVRFIFLIKGDHSTPFYKNKSCQESQIKEMLSNLRNLKNVEQDKLQAAKPGEIALFNGQCAIHNFPNDRRNRLLLLGQGHSV